MYSTFMRAIEILFNTIEILIVVRIFLNIFRISMNNLIGRIIYEVTEPILGLASTLLRRLGVRMGMLDFSPWVAILILRLIHYLILNILSSGV